MRGRVQQAAQSYIALRVSGDGTRTEVLVKDDVIVSERVVPDDEVWTGHVICNESNGGSHCQRSQPITHG